MLLTVTACDNFTGITDCGICAEKADADSAAPCLSCADGFYLKDGLQSGDDAECIGKNQGTLCQ